MNTRSITESYDTLQWFPRVALIKYIAKSEDTWHRYILSISTGAQCEELAGRSSYRYHFLPFRSPDHFGPSLDYWLGV